MNHTPDSDTQTALRCYATAEERRAQAQVYIHLSDETLTRRLGLHDSDPDMRCVIALAGKLRECANALLEAADTWQERGDHYAAHAGQPVTA